MKAAIDIERVARFLYTELNDDETLSPDIIVEMAEDPYSSEELLFALSFFESREVREALVRNPSITENIALDFSDRLYREYQGGGDEIQTLRALLENPSLTGAVLQENIGVDSSGEADRLIAEHPNMPPETAEVLYEAWKDDESDYSGVLSYLSINPNTPKNIVEAIGKHPHFKDWR